MNYRELMDSARRDVNQAVGKRMVPYFMKERQRISQMIVDAQAARNPEQLKQALQAQKTFEANIRRDMRG